ncbi:hypothetical protein H5410_043941 [Solanum commersonii]|uniref:Secreted protein n=1 Tax=Solanum commersonii TaxID=4109 RepID=A0A9J5XYK4_SOLCO|nr:hypothetical protein H5410_043941 [Solanum commersonii]
MFSWSWRWRWRWNSFFWSVLYQKQRVILPSRVLDYCIRTGSSSKYFNGGGRGVNDPKGVTKQKLHVIFNLYLNMKFNHTLLA